MATNLDDILLKFNIFGRYYVTFIILTGVVMVCDCMFSNNYVFAAMEVKYRCADQRFGNDSCASLSNSTEACAEWVYDDPHSFVAQFNLACQEWKRTLLGTVHSFGLMIGLIFIGLISDRIGRKTALIVTGFLQAVTGITKSFCTDYWLYVILEFVDAAFGSHSSPCFTLFSEIIGHEKRILFITMNYFGYAMGFLVLPLTAWAVSYWRYMLRIIYGVALLYVVLFFLIDESPRWLLSKGRKSEAVAILKKIAKISKVELDEKDLDDLAHVEMKSVKLTQLLKETFASRTLLKSFFICVTWWAASTFVSYGLQINSVSLQGNKYVNFSYMCLTEIIGEIMVAFLLLRFKRKMPLACSFCLAALMCVSQAFVPTGLSWLSVLLFMTGKIMAVACFSITYIYTTELFPTYTRNSMHALCSSLGRVGSIIAPQTPLLIPYWHGLPSLVCGVVSLVAGLVTLLAPNTTDEALPDTIQQAEAIGNQNSSKINGKEIFSLRRREKDDSKNGENRF